MSLSAGDLIGHYRIDRLLGSGGMGEVYLAQDVLLGRQVAVKFVSDGEAADSNLSRRLLQEAQAVADLDSPFICPIYDAGTAADGRPFIVMQYLEGETLTAHLARGRLTEALTARICAEISDALATAHARGIVHRDLKPSNILITPDGHAKLLDFGIAKFLPSSRFMAPDADTRSTLTAPHAFVGTPGYMSPEQVQRQSLDGRSDLFALGAVVYECLTGQPAFTGRQAIELIGEVLHVTPPPPSKLRPGLARAWDEICGRLLAKHPDQRCQTAAEASAVFRALDSAPQPWWRRGWIAVAAAIVVLSLGVGAGLPRWLRRAPPAPPPNVAIWLEKGIASLREGAFQQAVRALEEATRIFPDLPSAYARLAEARAELDDQSGAQAALLQLSQRFPDESALGAEDRLRLEAVRWLVQRDLGKAVTAYKRLLELRPRDAGAWIDLGRAQETAVLLTDAKASFRQALALDPQFQAAHLHLGIVESYEGLTDDSLAAFAEAERLCRASSNAEGLTEVLIRRGLLFDNQGENAKARLALDAAVATAKTIQSPFHLVRAQLALSSVTASEGHLADAERLASAASDAALEADLDVVAADGLVDLASTFQFLDKYEDAQRVLDKAARLVQKRTAPRTAARVQAQLGSLRVQQGDAAGALEAVTPALAFFKDHHYVRLELTALNIAARAYRAKEDLPKAHAATEEALRISEALHNEIQTADALVNLAGLAALTGDLPEALGYRERVEAIHRRQNDLASLPYDLTNRAEVLILLGRVDDASAALHEVEMGIERGLDGYVGRKSRVIVLRALAATVLNRSAEVLTILEPSGIDTSGTTWVAVMARALSDYARAKLKRPPMRVALPPPGALSAALRRERQYWIAATYLERAEYSHALAAASDGLEMLGTIESDELGWRLAAVGCAAVRGRNEHTKGQVMCGRSLTDAEGIRRKWILAAKPYEGRSDLISLQSIVGKQHR